MNSQIAGHCPQFHTIGVDTTRIYRTRIAVNLNTSNTRLYVTVQIRVKKKKTKKNKKMRRLGEQLIA